MWFLPKREQKVLSRARDEAGRQWPVPVVTTDELVSDNIRVPIGHDSDYPGEDYEYATKETPTGNGILHKLLFGISLKRNILMIGPVGTGKSWLAKAVFRMLRLRVYQQSIHEGTTVRDLTAWPKTTRRPGGDISTEMELSPLARAMLEGRPYIADEINRASVGVLAVLNHVLQYKELILPQPMMINGKLTDRIRAAEGFSLVMTMNPPGGRVEVNDLMADFMDRMFVIDVGYLPEAEEVDLLMKVAGTPDAALKTDIEILVHYANNMRQHSAKKPSFRALERTVQALKKYPHLDPIQTLQLKLGMAVAPSEVGQALETALVSKGFGQSFKNVWQRVRDVVVNVLPQPVVALAIHLASGNPKGNSDDVYNPARWWEVGKPSLPEQRRARERRDVLEKVMQIVTGFNIPLKAWYPLPGELGRMKTWRAMWDGKTLQPVEMNFVAEDLIKSSNEETVLGVLYHELFELLYRHPEGTSDEFLKLPGAAVLDNAVGDIWINTLGVKDFKGAKEWLMAKCREAYSPTHVNNSLKDTMAVMDRQPLYLQFGLGVIYEWVFGSPDPTIINEDVKKAIFALREDVKAVYLTTDVADHKRRMEALYHTPEFQSLVQQAVEQEAKSMAQGTEKEGKAGLMPNGDMGQAQSEEQKKKEQDVWDKLSDEQKNQLRQEAARKLAQQDQAEAAKDRPQMVDQSGNALTPDQIKKAIENSHKSVENAKEDMQKYEEDQVAQRMEEEIEAANRAKTERDRDGITESQQSIFDTRYQRVQGDVGRMRTVFRKFYQRQAGYWQRWLEKGVLDDGSLALAVAGEDRIFKKRKLPKQYKVRVSLLIDQSGSMSGPKIDAVADAVLMMLLAIEADQKNGITLEVVGFHDDKPAEIYFPYGEKLTRQKIVEIISHVANTYNGNADLRAMFHAFRRIPQNESNTMNLVIHFSDGDPNFQFSRDKFRQWINTKPHITVVGLGIGSGAGLILDLYPKGQGVWAENTREVPSKLETLLERFIGRHGRNGVAKTIRLSEHEVAEMESQAHTRAQGITVEGTVLAGMSALSKGIGAIEKLFSPQNRRVREPTSTSA